MREQFFEQGYYVARRVLDLDFVAELYDEVTRRLLPNQEHQFDTVCVSPEVPVFGKLVNNRTTLDYLREMGLDPKLMNGLFINKKPHEPRRPWHQDWWYWPHPASLDETPPQVGLMYYLHETTKENGCLRVIPGSHRNHHVIHDHYDDGNYTLADYPEEVAVEVTPGDMIIMDARLLHASYDNKTDQNRYGLTIWYATNMPAFPYEVQRRFGEYFSVDWYRHVDPWLLPLPAPVPLRCDASTYVPVLRKKS